MSDYETPTLTELGDISDVTQGQHFSRVDGNSGSDGNAGSGKGGT